MPKKTGFALQPPSKRLKGSRQGGLNAHKNGTAHEWTPEEAAVAGAKGGRALVKRKRDAELEALKSESGSSDTTA